MSVAVGTISAPEDIYFNTEMEKEERKKKKKKKTNVDALEKNGKNKQVDNENNLENKDGATMKSEEELDLGPQFSIKEQLEKDKDDESLRKWKEQLLGSVDLSAVGGRPDVTLPIPAPDNTNSKVACTFTLKEGTTYRLKFSFTVSNNFVSGLRYANSVWKTGVRVDNSKVMLETFSPQQEPYIYELEEDTAPSGMFARGSYSARTKVIDDDGKCYLDISYNFEIQKNWPSS